MFTNINVSLEDVTVGNYGEMHQYIKQPSDVEAVLFKISVLTNSPTTKLPILKSLLIDKSNEDFIKKLDNGDQDLTYESTFSLNSELLWLLRVDLFITIKDTYVIIYTNNTHFTITKQEYVELLVETGVTITELTMEEHRGFYRDGYPVCSGDCLILTTPITHLIELGNSIPFTELIDRVSTIDRESLLYLNYIAPKDGVNIIRDRFYGNEDVTTTPNITGTIVATDAYEILFTLDINSLKYHKVREFVFKFRNECGAYRTTPNVECINKINYAVSAEWTVLEEDELLEDIPELAGLIGDVDAIELVRVSSVLDACYGYVETSPTGDPVLDAILAELDRKLQEKTTNLCP